MPVFNGSNLSEVFLGSIGDDTIRGRGGDDTIIGSGGIDTGYGGSGDDTILVTLSSGVFYGGSGDDTFTGSAGDTTMYGGYGRDIFAGGTGDETMFGGRGYDRLDGGDGDDALHGDAGIDVLDGGRGADLLQGGADNDVLSGGDDADVLFGGRDNDTLFGGDGDDDLSGDRGDDALSGEDGNDIIDGGRGHDTVFGGDGRDEIAGGQGNDSIFGGKGNDDIRGDSGEDTILGGLGRDLIAGGVGKDSIDGGPDDDTISGGSGADTLSGGSGRDSISGGSGNDKIEGGSDRDRIDGGGGQDTIYGGEGRDEIDGGAGHDVIEGGFDDDIIDGGKGRDSINGGVGDDFIDGGDARDLIDGGVGNDEIYGGGGDDEIVGGADDDLIYGGDARDDLFGGGGNDTVFGGSSQDDIFGGVGDDVLGGDDGGDSILGGFGADTIYGDAGSDALYGGEDDDTIFGGLNRDSINPGSGNDVVDAGDGNDIVVYEYTENIGFANVLGGGAGNDFLVIRATHAQWFQTPLFFEYLDFVSDYQFPNDEFFGQDFVFESIDLTISEFEAILIEFTDARPVAEDDSFEGAEDTPLSGNVLLNDSDADGHALTASLFDGPANGTLIFAEDGSFTYTPDPNFSGTDSFRYRAVDETGLSSSPAGIVTLNITGTNDDPVAMDDIYVLPPTDTDIIDVSDVPDGTIIGIHDVARLANGNFVVVWNEGDVRAKVLAPDGTVVVPELQLHSEPAGLQNFPTVTALPDGGFAAVYSSNDRSEILLRMFDATGQETLPEQGVTDLVDATDLRNVKATTLSDGALAVVWAAEYPDRGFEVYARIIEPDGAPRTQDVLLNTAFQVGFQRNVDLDAVRGGGFVAVWSSAADPDQLGSDTGDRDARLAVFDASGVAVSPELVLNNPPLDSVPFAPSVTTLQNGQIVATWLSRPKDGDTLQPVKLQAAIFDASGKVVKATFDIATSETADGFSTPEVFDVADGFVIAWGEPDPADPDRDEGQVLAQRFSLDAEAVSAPVEIGETRNLAINLEGSTTSDGGFALSWRNFRQSDTAIDLDINLVFFDGATLASEDDVTEIAVADVLFNDTDPDGDVLTITQFSGFSDSDAVVYLDGDKIIYDPTNVADIQSLAEGDRLTDAFTYRISDGNGGIDIARVTVVVEGRNDGPTALDDKAVTSEGETVVINVLANDSDIDGDTLSIGEVTQGTQGTVTISSGFLVYEPAPGFVGQETFSYILTDQFGAKSEAVVTVMVEPGNDAPVAIDDSAVTRVGDAILIDVLANDRDPEDDPIEITQVTDPAFSNGTVEIVDGAILYTPDAAFAGTDAFAYEIADTAGNLATASVLVTVVENQAPLATDDAFVVNEDIPLSGLVVANDSDPEGDPLTVTLLEGATHGLLELRGDGTFDYTPHADFFGQDGFSYMVMDDRGGADMASVSIDVLPVNDAPVAVADVASTTFNTPILIDVLENDFDPEGDLFSIADITALDVGSGTVEVTEDGIAYMPTAGFAGQDSFTYRLTDGESLSNFARVDIEVAPNQAPVASNDSFATDEDQTLAGNVILNDTDVEGDPLSVLLLDGSDHGVLDLRADGTFDYTPFTNFNGTDSFAYRLSDPFGGSDTALVSLAVTPVNDLPIAVDDTGVSFGGAATFIDVLANDTDVDGGSLSILEFTNGSNGTVDLNTDQTLTYTPNAGFLGSDSFTYFITDNAGGIAQATVRMDALPNRPPVAVDDVITSVVEDRHAIFDVRSNDGDADGDPLGTKILTDVLDGRLVHHADGRYSYIPDPDFAQSDGFQYILTDGRDTAVGSVDINIKGVNDAPVITAPVAVAVTPGTGTTFAATDGTALLPFDLDAGSTSVVRVTLSANSGAFSLPGSSASVSVTGLGSNLLTLDGTIGDLQKALDGVRFASKATVPGIGISVEDLGNSGSGGNLGNMQFIAFSDSPIFGTSGDDPKLNGGAADDVIFGLAGNDTVSAGGGNDYIVTGEGNDTIFTGISDLETDLTKGTRDVVDAGAGDDTVTLNAETTVGLIRGGLGNDTVQINSAVFQGEINGGRGLNDRLVVALYATDLTGADVSGIEQTILNADLRFNAEAVDTLGSVSLAENRTITLASGGVAQFGDISIASAGAGSATLTVQMTAENSIVSLGLGSSTGIGSGARVVEGSDFDDVILGGSGTILTLLKGNEGDDVITGGVASEQVFGGDGDDVLAGGDGSDTLEGGLGNDLLAGGDGADTFVFSHDGSTDTILDFQLGEDVIYLEGTPGGTVLLRQSVDSSMNTEMVVSFDPEVSETVVAVFQGVEVEDMDIEDILVL